MQRYKKPLNLSFPYIPPNREMLVYPDVSKFINAMMAPPQRMRLLHL
ncbi:MAG: hypothetical protein WCL14_02850 [Bacteroidota bacterium]